MKYLKLASLFAVLLGLSLASQGIVVSHATERQIKRVQKYKIQALALQLTPTLQELKVIGVLPKGAKVEELSKLVNEYQSAYLIYWVDTKDKQGQSHSTLVFALYQPTLSLGQQKDEHRKHAKEIVHKFGRKWFKKVVEMSNVHLDRRSVLSLLGLSDSKQAA